MIVSDSHKFIFLHNPKCGGTSIRHALAAFDSSSEAFWRKVDPRLPRHDLAHMEAAYIEVYYPEVWSKIQRYFVFGFTREPLARFLSGFNETHKSHYLRLQDGADYLSTYRTVLRRYAENLLARPDAEAPYAHTFPQYRLFYSRNKCIADVVVPIDEACQVSSFMALAHFLDEAPWHELRKALTEGARRNSKPSRYAMEQLLDQDLLQGLRDYYRLDYQLFGYLSPA
jgi:hypothetical protein